MHPHLEPLITLRRQAHHHLGELLMRLLEEYLVPITLLVLEVDLELVVLLGRTILRRHSVHQVQQAHLVEAYLERLILLRRHLELVTTMLLTLQLLVHLITLEHRPLVHQILVVVCLDLPTSRPLEEDLVLLQTIILHLLEHHLHQHLGWEPALEMLTPTLTMVLVENPSPHTPKKIQLEPTFFKTLVRCQSTRIFHSKN
mmetsp:Transcript_2454/g.2381  ORF Transcript_2454/g.2381 Transcript_2454/m.2381 type:complete len:200 (-) Transcript_2454:60-659(-)